MSDNCTCYITFNNISLGYVIIRCSHCKELESTVSDLRKEIARLNEYASKRIAINERLTKERDGLLLWAQNRAEGIIDTPDGVDDEYSSREPESTGSTTE